MKRRKYLIAAILAVMCLAGSIAYLLRRIGPFAGGAHGTPVAGGQKVIRFGFDAAPQADGVPAPWRSTVIRGTMHFELVDGPAGSAGKALRVECEKSHFLLWNPASPYSSKDYPILTWSWKVAVLPTNADVRKHSPIPLLGENRNDAAVQVLVGFEGNDVLCYLWDSTAPVGTEVEEPSPVARVRTQVVDSGQAHLNEWISHRVNVVADYQRRFGKLPGRILGISVQTNSNHTASRCDGVVSEITARAE